MRMIHVLKMLGLDKSSLKAAANLPRPPKAEYLRHCWYLTASCSHQGIEGLSYISLLV